MAASVRPLVLRLDPSAGGDDPRTLRVTQRIRAVRDRTRVLSARIAALTRPFVDDALAHPWQAEEGQAARRQGRIRWLSRLAALHRSYCAACEEEARLQALLRRIDESVESIEGSAREQRDSPESGPAASQPPA